MRRAIATILVFSLVAGHVLAVGSKKAAYVGGTIESFNKHKKATKGELDLNNDKALIFNVKDQSIEVKYERITALEYQKTSKLRGALVGATIAASGVSSALVIATTGASLLAFPVIMVAMPFLKKKGHKRHYLTVAYRDADDKQQALILELGKEFEMEARAVISARSGKEVKVIVEDH